MQPSLKARLHVSKSSVSLGEISGRLHTLLRWQCKVSWAGEQWPHSRVATLVPHSHSSNPKQRRPDLTQSRKVTLQSTRMKKMFIWTDDHWAEYVCAIPIFFGLDWSRWKLVTHTCLASSSLPLLKCPRSLILPTITMLKNHHRQVVAVWQVGWTGCWLCKVKRNPAAAAAALLKAMFSVVRGVFRRQRPPPWLHP